MKSIAIFFALAWSIATGPATAQDISGLYAVGGTNPGGGDYTGEAEISRHGETYRVVANVGGTTMGTGIFLEGVLSVSFREAGWVASYVLQPDGSLSGIWAQDGGMQLGRETLTPMR